MNFLADESCAGPVVRALRAAGHDVIAIAEVAKGMADEDVVECALEEKRVLTGRRRPRPLGVSDVPQGQVGRV